MVAGQIVEDRTVGPVVPVAGVGELRERALHRLHLRDALLEIGDVGERDALHVAAGAAAVDPEPEQRLDLVQAEARGNCRRRRARTESRSA